MYAKGLRFEELLTKDPKLEFPLFAGQRLLVSGTATLRRFYDDLFRVMGPERAAIVFTRLGYDNGLAGGIGLKDMYEFETPDQLIEALPMVTPMIGAAKEINTQYTFDPENHSFHYSGEWLHSFESFIWHISQSQKSEEPICHMLCGFVSGYFSAIFGRDILVKEVSCRAQGFPSCKFEARPIEDWGEDKDFFHNIMKTESLDDELEFLRTELNRSQISLKEQRKEVESRKKVQLSNSFRSGIIYRSADMERIIELAEMAAPSDSTVLLQGESGSGKEVIARFIHENSPRAAEPFLAINCAAIPHNLVESELFGHLKGAFTGAEKDKNGLFIEAGKGTIFLDEIGELPFEVQAKLLRVLQQKEVLPLGSVKKADVKARTITATNQDLKQMVDEGTFRQDLYYRISVFPLLITPLRQRREDILVLARHFLTRLKMTHPGFSADTVKVMQRYSWPGNIRELENCVEYAYILSKNKTIQVDHLPLAVTSETTDFFSEMTTDFPSPKELVKRYAQFVVNHTKGSKTKAAKILGVSIPTLWRYLK